MSGFGTDEEAERWLALRASDPAAFEKLPVRCRDLAQMHDDLKDARAISEAKWK